jgi:hypothetical protein
MQYRRRYPNMSTLFANSRICLIISAYENISSVRSFFISSLLHGYDHAVPLRGQDDRVRGTRVLPCVHGHEHGFRSCVYAHAGARGDAHGHVYVYARGCALYRHVHVHARAHGCADARVNAYVHACLS